MLDPNGDSITVAADDRGPQIINDARRFFAGYAQIERHGSGWDLALEHADFLALLPNVQSLRVLAHTGSEWRPPKSSA